MSSEGTVGIEPSGKEIRDDYFEELEQSKPEYKWRSVKAGGPCGCLGFILQLVLVGCCGSFLFGFNIALLNTAVNVVFSEYQICGQPSGVVQYFYETFRKSKADALAFAQGAKSDLEASNCLVATDLEGNFIRSGCQQGYTNIICDSYKWYTAFIQTAVLIGGAFGAMFAGRLLYRGRRALFLNVMVVFSIGIIASVCANSFSAMMLARLVVGVGVGFVSVCSPTYISEVTPAKERGKYGVFHQLTIAVGIFVGILVGLPLPDPGEQDIFWEPTAFSMFWWRFMLGVGMVPVIIALYLLLTSYSFETPVYYVENGCYKDAHQLLERVYGKQDVRNELNICITSVKEGNEYRKKGFTLSKAFGNPKYRTVLLVGLFLAGFQQFGGINVFMTSSSDIFKKSGFSKAWQTGMSILMAAINVLMTFPTILLIERMGRKQLLFLGSLGQTLVLLPVAVSYWTEADQSKVSNVTGILSIVAVIGFVVFFAIAFGPIVWVYLFEIFPMELKDAASSTCTAFNWIAAIIMVFLANVLPNSVSFTLFAILQLIATIFIWLFMRETKGLPLGVSPYIKEKEKNSISV